MAFLFVIGEDATVAANRPLIGAWGHVSELEGHGSMNDQVASIHE